MDDGERPEVLDCLLRIQHNCRDLDRLLSPNPHPSLAVFTLSGRVLVLLVLAFVVGRSLVPTRQAGVAAGRLHQLLDELDDDPHEVLLAGRELEQRVEDSGNERRGKTRVRDHVACARHPGSAKRVVWNDTAWHPRSRVNILRRPISSP